MLQISKLKGFRVSVATESKHTSDRRDPTAGCQSPCLHGTAVSCVYGFTCRLLCGRGSISNKSKLYTQRQEPGDSGDNATLSLQLRKYVHKDVEVAQSSDLVKRGKTAQRPNRPYSVALRLTPLSNPCTGYNEIPATLGPIGLKAHDSRSESE